MVGIIRHKRENEWQKKRTKCTERTKSRVGICRRVYPVADLPDIPTAKFRWDILEGNILLGKDLLKSRRDTTRREHQDGTWLTGISRRVSISRTFAGSEGGGTIPSSGSRLVLIERGLRQKGNGRRSCLLIWDRAEIREKKRTFATFGTTFAVITIFTGTDENGSTTTKAGKNIHPQRITDRHGQKTDEWAAHD